jgi:hypothetical protein
MRFTCQPSHCHHADQVMLQRLELHISKIIKLSRPWRLSLIHSRKKDNTDLGYQYLCYLLSALHWFISFNAKDCEYQAISTHPSESAPAIVSPPFMQAMQVLHLIANVIMHTLSACMIRMITIIIRELSNRRCPIVTRYFKLPCEAAHKSYALGGAACAYLCIQFEIHSIDHFIVGVITKDHHHVLERR